jgi:hypothetical protein
MSQASRVFKFNKNNPLPPFQMISPVQRTKVVYLFLENSIPFVPDQLFIKHFPNIDVVSTLVNEDTLKNNLQNILGIYKNKITLYLLNISSNQITNYIIPFIKSPENNFFLINCKFIALWSTNFILRDYVNTHIPPLPIYFTLEDDTNMANILTSSARYLENVYLIQNSATSSDPYVVAYKNYLETFGITVLYSDSVKGNTNLENASIIYIYDENPEFLLIIIQNIDPFFKGSIHIATIGPTSRKMCEDIIKNRPKYCKDISIILPSTNLCLDNTHEWVIDNKHDLNTNIFPCIMCMYHCLYNCNRIEEILIKPNLISKQKFGCANRFINSLILPEEITTILYVVSYLYSSLSEYNKLKLMRQKQGYTVYEIVIQENETFEVIKTKINTLHSRNKLKYICIIGNEKEIATNMRKVKPVNIDEEEIDEIPIIIAASDLMYGVNYNKIEIIVGRISSGLSENETNIKNQINKILTYEKLNDDLNIKNVNNIENKWSSKVIGIASDQYVGSFKDNEYMRNELKSFETNIDQTRINITYVELFEGYIGENVTDLENIIDKTGNPTSAELETYINNGATLIEYLGHGTDTLLRTTNFDITNVDNLNNINKYFLFISAACLIGAFHNDTLTLAEKFQFAKDSGSIAVFASSVEQSWEPPKKMLSSINKLIQKSPEKYITIGDLFYQGVTDHEFLHISLGGLNEDDESYYYNLFGDPSTKYNLCKLVNTLTDVNTLVYRASASKIRRP